MDDVTRLPGEALSNGAGWGRFARGVVLAGPQLLIGWTRLLSGRVRDPLVGRDVLIGVAAGTVAALLIASRELIPRILGRPPGTPDLPSGLVLLGARYGLALSLQTIRRALVNVSRGDEPLFGRTLLD
jgi:hypothetical protein